MNRMVLSLLAIILSFSVQAQRCAVLEFKARVGISQNEVDGISGMFITYFKPSGYTMVERTQIDNVIEEQGFQRSKITEDQAIHIGKILNVSKIVIGDINILMGQYNVDVRIINVQSGTIAATGGETFTGGTSYRTTMQKLAQNLASQIAIVPSGTQSTLSGPTSAVKRSSVETLYGYLKIFPNELGVFQEEPVNVIRQINARAQHGYNNWRIPTNEELSLMRANNYLRRGDYMTKESKHGIVLLVTDGDDYATVQAEEQGIANKRAEQQRQQLIRIKQEAQEAREAAEARQARLVMDRKKELLFMDVNGNISDTPKTGSIWYGHRAISRYSNIPPNGWRLPTLEDIKYIFKRYPRFREGNIVYALELKFIPEGCRVVAKIASQTSEGSLLTEGLSIGVLEHGSPSDPIIDSMGNFAQHLSKIRVMFVKNKY